MKLNVWDWIALVLAIIGSLNWGLALFKINLVDMLFGAGPIAMIIYALVGLSGIYLIFAIGRFRRG